jgi:hypothetical protein
MDLSKRLGFKFLTKKSYLDDLKQFLVDWSELEGIVEEELGWRYIRTSCDTTDAQLRFLIEKGFFHFPRKR